MIANGRVLSSRDYPPSLGDFSKSALFVRCAAVDDSAADVRQITGRAQSIDAAQNESPLAAAGVGDGLADAGFVGADDGVDDVSALVVDDDVRNGSHVVFLREIMMFIDIDLLQDNVGVAFRNLLQDRADLSARAAPIRIEIDNRDLAALRLDGSARGRTGSGCGNSCGFGPGRGRLDGSIEVLATDRDIGHLGSRNELFDASRGGQREQAVVEPQQPSTRNQVVARGDRGGLGIKSDPLDLLETDVRDAAVLVRNLQLLVEQAEDMTLGFRAVLKFDHIRAGANSGRETQAGKPYSLHNG